MASPTLVIQTNKPEILQKGFGRTTFLMFIIVATYLNMPPNSNTVHDYNSWLSMHTVSQNTYK
jgi:hypothetical protein